MSLADEVEADLEIRFCRGKGREVQDVMAALVSFRDSRSSGKCGEVGRRNSIPASRKLRRIECASRAGERAEQGPSIGGGLNIMFIMERDAGWRSRK